MDACELDKFPDFVQMNLSSNGTLWPCKNKVNGDVEGSKLTGCL